MALRTVRFYRTESGECPVERFLDSLPQKQASKAVAVMKLLEHQPRLADRVLRKLTGTELFEIRVSIAKHAYRFPCFFAGNTIVVLTHGFEKKTRKTPARELKRAEQYRLDYLRRFG